VPKCTIPGVSTIPSPTTFWRMTEEELMSVPNFQIFKKGSGSIRFLEPVDVIGLDIDSVVEFGNREIIVYPEEQNKPRRGTGLNKRAQITLENCFPLDKETLRPSKDRVVIDEFINRLKSKCQRYHSEFVSYNESTGEWVFNVDGF